MTARTPEVTESTAPAAVTADLVLQMLAMTSHVGVISVDGDGALRVETVGEAFAASREAVSEQSTARRWNGHRPFTRADASRYAAYLTTIL
jgi:uncharacterized protein YaiI (UPF0178 family)